MQKLQRKTISSLEIAEMLNTSHCKLIRKLEGGSDRKGYIQILAEAQMGVSDYFIKDSYRDLSGKANTCYQFTKLGCDFIANKFNGEKGILFTARYVHKFHQMQSCLLEYKPKMTSLGEVASYIKQVSRQMEKQGSSAEEIMQMIDGINAQFGVRLPAFAKRDIWNGSQIFFVEMQ